MFITHSFCISPFFSYLSRYPFLFFFFNDTATTEIYTLSLHDALPIWGKSRSSVRTGRSGAFNMSSRAEAEGSQDRKSTRLNSSHTVISYAVFCLKKKKKKKKKQKKSKKERTQDAQYDNHNNHQHKTQC